MRVVVLLIAAAALIMPNEVMAQQHVTSKCEMMWADLGSASDGSRPTQLQRATFDELPASVHDLLPSIRSDRGTYLVYQLPTTDGEYRQLYPDKLISKPVQDEIGRARDAFPATRIDQGRGVTASTFAKSISEVESDVVIVIGHNVEGEFGFVDGSYRALVDLVDDCGAARKLCIFLSCQSARFLSSNGVGVGRQITFDDAITMAKAIEAKILEKKGAEMTYADVEKIVKDLDVDGARAIVTVAVLKGCGVGAGGVGVVYAVDSMNGSPAQPTP